MTVLNLVDTACTALGIDPLTQGLQIISAEKLAQKYFPPIDCDAPVMLVQIANREIAQACAHVLALVYPRDHHVTLVDAAGKYETLALTELEQAAWASIVYVPPRAQPSSLNALGEVVAHLRAPNGCPWDRAQTHQSLRKDFLEECYEVLETLDENDIPHLREELGDLLLHIFLQAQIASESGEFLLTDVVADITAKLIRRHPHVFADVQVNGIDEIVGNWEKIKQAENGGKPKKSNIPRELPALARAQKIAKRAKIKTSVAEMGASLAKLARARKREQAFGDLLFALAAFANDKHIDAESALRRRVAQPIR
jgi:tetrapyrrole methylase family protein/MazG family protein